MAADAMIRAIKTLRWYDLPEYFLLLEECRREATGELMGFTEMGPDGQPVRKVEFLLNTDLMLNRAQELAGQGKHVALINRTRCFIRHPSPKIHGGVVTLELMHEMDREGRKTGLKFVDISEI